MFRSSSYRLLSSHFLRPAAGNGSPREPPKAGIAPKKKRKEDHTMVIKRRGEFMYGVGPCTAALQARRRKIYAVYQKAGCIEKKAASKRAALSSVKMHKITEELKVDYRQVDRDALDRLTGGRPHQGIVLDVAPLNTIRMEFTTCRLSEKESRKNPIWILLDQIQDPMNLGAILRCSYYLGVDRIITSSKNCCPLSPAVSKASAGAMELMTVFAVSNLEKLVKEAKAEGWTILGTSGPELAESDDDDEEEWEAKKKKKKLNIPSVDCYDYTRHGPTLLVLGNEGRGLNREVEAQCDVILTVGASRQLPVGFDSLNVGVAAGILLHSLQRPITP